MWNAEGGVPNVQNAECRKREFWKIKKNNRTQQNSKMLVCVKTFEIESDIFVEHCFTQSTEFNFIC